MSQPFIFIGVIVKERCNNPSYFVFEFIAWIIYGASRGLTPAIFYSVAVYSLE